jgi:putative ABC transport system ATP-binding protein
MSEQNSRIVLELFRKVNEDLGQTIVMVTHEEWHKSYLDRIIYVRDGLLDATRMHEDGGDVPCKQE